MGDTQNYQFCKPLFYLHQKPSEDYIIGRYLTLTKENKQQKSKNILIIYKELTSLWLKVNEPTMKKKNIIRKIELLLKKYQNKIKKSKKIGLFKNIFDITSKSTNKEIPKSGQVSNELDEGSSFSETDSIDENYLPTTYIQKSLNKKEKPPMVGALLGNNAKMSSSKACNVCKELSSCGLNIPTPVQSTVWRQCLKASEAREAEYINSLKNDLWALHFDGKKIKGKEIQVILLKNAGKEIKLGALVLNDGKSATIFNGILEVIEKFDLLDSIKVIICDTTAVNTGKRNGIVSKLQNYYISKGKIPPQYISCQHHVLDLVLRHAMDQKFGNL